MKIQSIKINNILSIGEATLSFQESGLVLVEGWNFDAERANGAGKTAIFNSISFCLFDKIPRKITASEILKRGTKTGFCEIELLSSSDRWKVKRTRPKGVEFYKNDVKLDISQQEFESHIRFSYDQFVLTVYNSQSNSDNLRFLSRSDTDKKSFLLQLLNLNLFSDLKKNADDIIKKISLEMDSNISKMRSVQSKIDAYSESLIDTESLTNELSAINNKIAPIDQELVSLSNVEKPDLSKFKQLEDDLSSKQLEVVNAKALLHQMHDRYKELSNIVNTGYDSGATCSECGASIDTEEARTLHDQRHTSASLKIKSIKSKIDDLDKIVVKESSLKELANKLRDKKNNILSDYHSASARSAELKSCKAILHNKRDSILSKIDSNKSLISKIDNLSQVVSSLSKEIEEQRSTLDVYKALSAVYSPTGAQAYILDSIVESFNDVVKQYIDIIWPNAYYFLQSYKETAKGDVVAKFSESLTMDGVEVSIGSLSGGEFRALSLCIDFALLEVLSSRFGLDINPIILDEPFDGLDSMGREVAISLLSQLSRDHQILVVDHASESKALFSKIIKVEKKNGTSLIEEV